MSFVTTGTKIFTLNFTYHSASPTLLIVTQLVSILLQVGNAA
jgi:hypothetical protein